MKNETAEMYEREAEVTAMFQDSFSERAVYVGRTLLIAVGAVALALVASAF